MKFNIPKFFFKINPSGLDVSLFQPLSLQSKILLRETFLRTKPSKTELRQVIQAKLPPRTNREKAYPVCAIREIFMFAEVQYYSRKVGRILILLWPVLSDIFFCLARS